MLATQIQKMQDISWPRTGTRWPWKMMLVPVVIIVCATYTLYPFTSSPISQVSSGSKTTTSPSGAQYTAVMIETHFDDTLVPIILQFASVLAPWWTIIIFTLEEHWKMPPSSAFRRALAEQKVSIRYLPPGTVLEESGAVSRFFAKPWLWEQLQWADRILLFQADSILCSRAETTVEDFLGYDYIGAPIAEEYGEGYNGGLSIRNPSLFLRITQEANFEQSGEEFEDQWFYKEAKARVEHGVQLPEADIAKTFSVETMYYDKPLGYHQPARWHADRMHDIEAWCPEVKMILPRRAYNEDGV